MYPIGMLGRSPRRSPLEVLGQASAWRDRRGLPAAVRKPGMAPGGRALGNAGGCLVRGEEGSVPREQRRTPLRGCRGGALGKLPGTAAGERSDHCARSRRRHGPFARYVLDEFEALCRAEGRDFYERLTYIITDRSPVTVEFWTANGIFANHAGRVRAEVADAAPPVSATDGPLRAVFCNYVLDTLAGSTLRRSASGWEQLCVRTWIDDDAEHCASTRR